MFKCDKCAIYREQIVFLQGQVDKLTDQILTLTDPQTALLMKVKPEKTDSKDYYGNEFDEMIEHNEFGEQIIKLRSDYNG